MSTRVRIAIQKSGRLTDKSLELLRRCGLDFDYRASMLMCHVRNFPIDMMFLRDDDIPETVASGTCDLGIVGQNVLEEKTALGRVSAKDIRIIKPLGFGKCRLSIAVPKEHAEASIEGLRIATSYPGLTRQYLDNHNLNDCKIFNISGSVEITPILDMADAVCDLVSSGDTLRANGLVETQTVMKSESVLTQSSQSDDIEKIATIDRLLSRINGVMKANETKYIMMNAPREALDQIRDILPGMEEPSIIPLGSVINRVAVHAVCREDFFWETMEKLKAVGASSILVLNIEKIID